MIYEKPDMLILMMDVDDEDVICTSMPDGIEDGTGGTTLPGTDGNDVAPFN